MPKNAVNDTISKKDTIVVKKESLDDILRTKADDQRRDIPKKMTFLNKNAQVKYQDMQIDADYISIDDNKSLIYARGKQDSLGKIIEPVITMQGGKSMKPTSSAIIQKRNRLLLSMPERKKVKGSLSLRKQKNTTIQCTP